MSRHPLRFLTRIFLACLLLVSAQAGWAQQFPKLTGRVVDAANLIDPPREAQIVARLEALEKQSGRQLVVVTLPDLQGYDISDYGYRLGRAWGIGDKERDDGALLIVAPTERKVRIEVGYGLEGILTDALSSQIIRNTIVPRFKANDYPGGIVAGSNAIADLLALPADEARKRAELAAKEAQKTQGGSDIGTAIFVLFIVFFFIVPMFFGRRRGRAFRDGVAPAILWGPSIGSGWGGGSSGWGGGGGFGGGGGGFGGGGSSGSW